MRATHFSRQMGRVVAAEIHLRRRLLEAANHSPLHIRQAVDGVRERIANDNFEPGLRSKSLADAVATLFSTQMAQLTANTGGAVQSLPSVSVAGGKQRQFIANLALAAQVSGSVFGMARLPLYAVLTGITLITDTSLGTSTISFGDTNSAAIYAAAQTFTTTQVPTRVGLAATHGAPITSGYDSVTGNLVTPFMPQTPGEGGLVYEDIVMTTGVASLPASGNFVAIFEYSID